MRPRWLGSACDQSPLEAGARRADCALNIRGIAGRYAGDDLTGRGIFRRERHAARRQHRSAVNDVAVGAQNLGEVLVVDYLNIPTRKP
jgi:hypothetical protein